MHQIVRSSAPMRLSFVLLCLLAIASSTEARADAIDPDVDLKAFGNLPAWFNGRTTTWDAVARVYLKWISGREVWFDDAGREQPAIRWLLDIAAQRDSVPTRRILLIEDPALVKFLALPQRSDPPGQASRYSHAELIPKVRDFQKRCEELHRKAPAACGAADVAFLALHERLSTLFQLNWSLNSIRIDGQDAETAIARARELDHAGFPAVVPPAGQGAWETLNLSRLRSDADKEKRADFTYSVSLRSLLTDYAKGDGRAFDRDVRAYRDALHSSGVLKRPRRSVHFTLPYSWLELGAPSAGEVDYYNDMHAYGGVIAALRIGVGPHKAQVDVHEFAGPIAPLEQVVNYWRVDYGLTPLHAEHAVALPAADAFGHRGVRVVLATPAGALDQPRKAVSVLAWDGKRAWEISLYGDPDLVDQETAAFDAFVKSLKVDEGGASDRDLPPLIRQDKWDPARTLGAVMLDGPRAWIVKLIGPPDAVAAEEKTFTTFVESLRVGPVDGGLVLDWTRPEGYQVGDTAHGYANFVGGSADAPTFLHITRLDLSEKTTLDQLLPLLANVWRAEAGADAMGAAEIMARVRHLKAGANDVAMVDVPPRKVERTRQAATAPEALRPVYALPAGWHEEPPGALQSIRFSAGTGGAVSIGIFVFEGSQPLALNVNRWRTRLNLGPQTEDEAAKSAMPIRVNGAEGQFFDLKSPTDPPKRMLIVHVRHDGKTWYFRMEGPAMEVEQQIDSYKAFIASVNFPEK